MNKNTKIVAALIAIGLVSPMAYATNGDEMMAVGSQSTALGGTGVANFMGADSVFANPAMLGKSKGSEVTGGVNLFTPKVTNTGFTGTTAASSSASTNVIPDVSFSSRINDNLTYGVAMAGIAGMGVDYTGASASYVKAKTTMSILRVIPTIAYNDKDYGLGFSPVLQYGSLAISYTTQNGATNADHNADTNTAYGYSFGGYYNVMPSLTVGAAYQSPINMKYGTQLSVAGTGFGQTFADNLEQPAEMKAGVAYTMSNITLTADYKNIQWSSAKGYKEFGWKDQSIVAVGAKYSGNGFWLGAGYNSADDPIGTFNGAAFAAGGHFKDGQNGIGNFFNNMMFPAIVKSSYTFGGGYDISKTLAVEAAAVITPEVTKTVDVSDATYSGTGTPPPAGSLFNTTTHSQTAYSVSLRYKF